ncbi:transcription factor IIIB 50 kDa subunit-like [Brevipalpus obovatus]|uniref:transcription factor IIIB 50 kDa subunit-like n=1 Tax=Brevipalpus obovatus TaxID=246614 RepID=UPI003D9E9BAF
MKSQEEDWSIDQCPKCKTSDVVLEQGEQICSECGLILCASDLRNSHDQDGVSFITNNNVFNKCNNLPLSVRRALASTGTKRVQKTVIQTAESMARYLNLNSSNIAKIEHSIRKLWQNPTFKHRSIPSKKILAAVCVYLVALNSDVVVSMECICEQAGCSGSQFKKYLNLFLSQVNEMKPQFRAISEWLPFFLNQANFGEKEKFEIGKKAELLLELFNSIESLESCKPKNVIVATLFIAWKSMDFRQRQNFKLTQFCKKFHLEYSCTTSKRAQSFCSIISELSTYLKWFIPVNSRSKEDFLVYLDDILTYSDSVRAKYQEKHKKTSSPIQEESKLMEYFKNNTALDTSNAPDPEISDEEIEKYIRTTEEIEMMKIFRKQAEDNHENDHEKLSTNTRKSKRKKAH